MEIKCIQTKCISDSKVELAELMMPEHTNPAGNVHGGTIIRIIDNAGYIVAARHSHRNVVTASIDKIDFLAPVFIGNVIFAKASLNFVSKTSMEIGVRVESERLRDGAHTHVASAYLTYVALDKNKKPIEIPRMKLETMEEERRFKEGKARREKRIKERKK